MDTLSALHTDLYQLTMAEGYRKLGMQDRRAAFELFFRKTPFHGGYAIACGLEAAIHWLLNLTYTDDDINYLASLKDSQDDPLFQKDFLQALKNISLSVDIDAMEEGTFVFARQPLLRVTGPLWQCQLLETTLLNLINFPTLIATKASRVCKAAGKNEVIEFGLRRAQGRDGGLTASRACYVGGTTATSNVLAGKKFGIPVVGTHAHSWVMAFTSEEEAFQNYAKVMPNNCTLLVDTYKSTEGIKNAIKVGLALQQRGGTLFAIRLDSGDLASLSIEARKLLDEAGLKNTKIIGSSDLDEYAITQLRERGSKIDIFGVGTRMVTGYDQPALGGVYKLMALQDEKQHWCLRQKRSDDPDKHSLPGLHGIFRVQENNHYVKDVMYNILAEKNLPNHTHGEVLLKPILRQGKLVYQFPSLKQIQQKTLENIEKFPSSITSLVPTELYPVELRN